MEEFSRNSHYKSGQLVTKFPAFKTIFSAL